MKHVFDLIHDMLHEQLSILVLVFINTATAKYKRQIQYVAWIRVEYGDQNSRACAHPWHLPESLGRCEQPFLPDPGTEPICNNWKTNRISLSLRVRNSLVAPTCLACMEIKKSAIKITPSITCFFIIITYFSRTRKGKKVDLLRSFYDLYRRVWVACRIWIWDDIYKRWFRFLWYFYLGRTGFLHWTEKMNIETDQTS